MKCNFTFTEKCTEWYLYECDRCGRIVKILNEDTPIHAICKPGLGDRVESTLSAFGITKARVNWVRKKFGITKPCKCPQVQEALNEMGKSIGF